MVEGRKSIDVSPYFFVAGVKNMCAVAVYGDAIDGFRVDIATDVGPFFED